MRAIKFQKETSRSRLADLVDEYGGSVYKFCRSLAYSKEDADDLFQETFLRVFEDSQKINACDDPRGFLFSAAIFVHKSWKRKYARRNRIAPAAAPDETAASGDDVESGVITREEARIVRDLVKSLPEKFRIPIILYYTMELSVPDIAQAMRLPAGTVKSRLFKARKLIEKGLGEVL
ncbi:MAG: RNA polymerase sigma factor [Gracilibacteraceae bacterium]|nr:RNA polymerase sigma factor [Gracilibacteraceae bacterium]